MFVVLPPILYNAWGTIAVLNLTSVLRLQSRNFPACQMILLCLQINHNDPALHTDCSGDSVHFLESMSALCLHGPAVYILGSGVGSVS